MISTSAELEELIDSTVSIPTIPTTLLEINRVMSSPDGSAREAGEIIEKDPALAAKVLRLVNSSFYALRNTVTSIPLACSILGFKVIKNVAVQATVLDSFSGVAGIEAFDPNWLWDHSFKTALAARMLAEASNGAFGLDKEEAYTCGLVHDVGKMLLLEGQPERFAEALQHSNDTGLPLAKAEGELFGFSHAHVGGLLAQRWRLSNELQEAVVYHHSPGANPEQWARGFLIHIANGIAHEVAASGGGYRGDTVDADAMRAIGVDDATLDGIRDEVALASIDG
ncbi:MAG: HDOD domain-containing protein [Planctomycetota bacterium]